MPVRKQKAEHVKMISRQAKAAVTKRNRKITMPVFKCMDENDCSGHVASANDAMVCGRCGVHINSLRVD